MKKSVAVYVIRLALIFNALLVFTLPSLGCQPEQQGQVQEVTIELLFANPDQYKSEKVIIEGFYFTGFEVQVIAERLDYSGYAEGHIVPGGRIVWIEGGAPEEVIDKLYIQQMMGPEERYGKVRLEGKFEYGGKYGHGGEYDSQIITSKAELLEWSPQTITSIKEFSREESQQIAEEFVKNSPTFMFDGIEETLKLTETLPPVVTLSGWQFAFEFDSRHAGYGDRTGQVLAQVITPHQAVIVVEQGKVTHAVIDEKWDMIKQQEIK